MPVIQSVIPIVNGVMGLFSAFSGDGPVDYNQVQNSAQQIGQGVVGAQDAWDQYQDNRDARDAANQQDLQTLEGQIIRARNEIASYEAQMEVLEGQMASSPDPDSLRATYQDLEDARDNLRTALENLERQYREAGGDLSSIPEGTVTGDINVTDPVVDPQDQDSSVSVVDIGDTPGGNVNDADQARLEQEAADRAARQAELNESIAKATAKVTELESRVEGFESEIKATEDQIRSLVDDFHETVPPYEVFPDDPPNDIENMPAFLEERLGRVERKAQGGGHDGRNARAALERARPKYDALMSLFATLRELEQQLDGIEVELELARESITSDQAELANLN